ncbi:hypothetical protein BCR33DRAFT_860525 [Rhizoclosmatium globosum]|uniref:Uncharacterized protein n=1 Tax=Rhizoclosmatium globosum TaxID=329046 RepID=A0A1Y2ANI4_9FUNG|nr:hypothetical protein BCR33DRAFT_860525 [Rhizoclosmatium globosum]|eukprot:ORY24044.1 hypothetical protein BCR33DRAFT_860525 [Rhizoclosmatium globosum]
MSHYSPKAKRRRLMIRETYQRLTNPLPPSQQLENNTYGDIIILPIPENPHTANTIKPITFLSSLLTKTPTSATPSFQKQMTTHTSTIPLLQNLHPPKHQPQKRDYRTKLHRLPTLPLRNRPTLYTLPRNVRHTRFPILQNPLQNHPEDALVGKLLERHTSILHTTTRSSAWRTVKRLISMLGIMRLGKRPRCPGGAINPHKLKRDVDFLGVAALFDEKGLWKIAWVKGSSQVEMECILSDDED